MNTAGHRIDADTFDRRYGTSNKPIEQAIRKELLAGELSFVAAERLSRLANTLIVKRSPLAGPTLLALEQAKKVIRSQGEEIISRYSLEGEDYPDPLEGLPRTYDPLQFQNDGPLPVSAPEPELHYADLRARYWTKTEKVDALIARAIRAEIPEGNDTIDAMSALNQTVFKLRTVSPDASHLARQAIEHLKEVYEDIRYRIEWKYNIGFCREPKESV